MEGPKPLRPVPARSFVEQVEFYMNNPPKGSVVMDIRPADAQEAVDKYNQHNRPPKPRKIAEFASDMTDECWKETGDTIKFTDLRMLGDGQHRLFACIKSGKPFRTHVVFNIDHEVFPWLDRGKPRSGSDVLAVYGIQNSTAIAAMVRWLEMFRQGRVKERLTLTPQQTLEAFEKFYNTDVMAVALSEARKVYAADATPISLAGCLYFQFAKRDPDLARNFFEAWATRNFGGRMLPLRKASEHLARLYQASNGRVHDTVRAAVLVRTWNLVVNKQKGTMPDFRWTNKDPFPAILVRAKNGK